MVWLGNGEAAREVPEKYKRKAAALVHFQHMIDSLAVISEAQSVDPAVSCPQGPGEGSTLRKRRHVEDARKKKYCRGPCGLGLTQWQCRVVAVLIAFALAPTDHRLQLSLA